MSWDAAELGRLIDRHAAALELFARQWTVAVDDVVQEAFVELVRQSVVPDDPVAWLYRVVRNRAVSAARSTSRRHRHEQAAAQDRSSWFVPSPETEIDAAAVADRLAELPDDQREAVVAHLWGGLSFEQIGAVAGVSSSTAHRRYVAGLETLRNAMRIPCPES